MYPQDDCFLMCMYYDGGGYLIGLEILDTTVLNDCSFGAVAVG